MNKTFTFNENELRLTDTHIEIDMKEIPYTEVERISYKEAVFGVRGELRVKPKLTEETRFYFKPVINKQVRDIAAFICKKSEIGPRVLTKGKSRLPFLLAPLGLIIAAVIVFFIFFNEKEDAGMLVGGGFDDFGWHEEIYHEEVYVEPQDLRQNLFTANEIISKLNELSADEFAEWMLEILNEHPNGTLIIENR